MSALAATAAPATVPLPLFHLSSRVEDPVVSLYEEVELDRLYYESQLKERSRALNSVIVGVVDSLLTHARSTDWKDRLKAIVSSTASKQRYEVDMFHFTHVKVLVDPTRYYPEHMASADEIANRSGEETLLRHLPFAVRTELTEYQKDMPLHHILTCKYLTMPLLSLFLGSKMKAVLRTHAKETFFDGMYEVQHMSIAVKYFPKGIPQCEAIWLNMAKELWGLEDNAWGDGWRVLPT